MSQTERLNKFPAQTVKLSLVICTRNRANLLSDLLESILRQDETSQNFEVIIIDNGSQDETRRITQNHQGIPNLKYVLELQIGLSYARNRGWQEAKGEYVAYLDDESKLPPEWLRVALGLANSIQPDAFGGPYYGFYSDKKPKWFKDEYGSSALNRAAGPLNPTEFLSGTNMVIRRDLLQSCGGFATAFGMSGKKIGYGEETHFFKKLREQKADATIYYDPTLYVYHLVRPEKMNLLSIAKTRLAGGRDAYRIWPGRQPATKFLVLRRILWIMRQFMKESGLGMIRRDKQKYPHLQNYLYECSFVRLHELGHFFAMLRGENKQEQDSSS